MEMMRTVELRTTARWSWNEEAEIWMWMLMAAPVAPQKNTIFREISHEIRWKYRNE